MFPMNTDYKVPFLYPKDLVRLVKITVKDPAKHHTRIVCVISQKVTPIEIFKSWNKGMRRGMFPSYRIAQVPSAIMAVHQLLGLKQDSNQYPRRNFGI